MLFQHYYLGLYPLYTENAPIRFFCYILNPKKNAFKENFYFSSRSKFWSPREAWFAHKKFILKRVSNQFFSIHYLLIFLQSNNPLGYCVIPKKKYQMWELKIPDVQLLFLFCLWITCFKLFLTQLFIFLIDDLQ